MSLGGWIKIHRALADHHISSDPQVLSVWLHLLMLANHSATKRLINGRVLVIDVGQLMTSRKSLSAKTGVQESKIERILTMLKRGQHIEQQGTTKFRLISIVNWSSYQIAEQQNEQQMNNRRTADEQQMNTLEEVIPVGITEECEEGKEKRLAHQQADELFARFWNLYPNKKGKAAAEKAWAKLKADSQLFDRIAEGLARQVVCQAWVKDGGAFIPHPATWLNGRRWEDEVKDPASPQSRHHGFERRDYYEGLTQREDGTYGI